MDVAIQTAAERIARVLAGQRLSINADGQEESAGDLVEARYREYLDDALAVLKTLREPSAAMAKAGDPYVWERMILTAIDEARPGVAM